MKLLRLLVIASLLAAGFAFFHTMPSASAECISLSGNGDTDLYIGPFSMSAGSSVTVTMKTDAGDGTAIDIFVDGPLVFSSTKYTAQHTITYSFPADSSNVTLALNWEYNGQPSNSYTVTTSDCGVLPIIPEQAVSGTFVERAELYYEPGKLIMPMMYAEVGKTFLVAGQDETGMYRKVLIACTWVWVRAETVGPNFDAVWNGTPLPTTVVEVEPSYACPAGQAPVDVPVEEGRENGVVAIAE